MTATPIPPTLGLVLAGGLARRMGGGDKARIEIGGVSILDRVLARCRRNAPASSSTPMAIRHASPIPAAPSCPTTCRTSRARSPASWPGSTGWRRRTTASNGCSACRATARSCRTIWSSAACGPPQAGRRRAARLRALRRMASSGGGPMAAGAARGLAQGAGRGGPAQDRGVDGAARCRRRRLAGRADRSVLQRQYARRCRARRRALRCSIQGR